MSAKQAKRLRKAAMGLAASLSEAGREIHQRGLFAKQHVRSTGASFRSDGASRNMPDEEVYAVTAVNRPDSLRGIVRTIKKGMKSGKIPKLPSGKVAEQ